MSNVNKAANAPYYGRTITKTAECDGILKNSIRPASLRLAIMQKIARAKHTDDVYGTVARAADGRTWRIHVGEVRSAVQWGLITLGGKPAKAPKAAPAQVAA